MKVNDIFEYLNSLFPCDTALAFDNPGLLVGSGENEISNVLVALDCTFDTVNIAIENNCNLIVTHHPVIFDGLKSVTDESIVYTLIKNNISVISMHTNLDMGDGGVNDALCEKIGLKNITKITDSEGFILRKGEIAPLPCDALAKQIREALGGAVKYSDNGKEIRNVLVCSGSGGDYIYLAKELGLDALITADVKHNIFTTAANLDIAVFDAGHFDTEDVIVDPLCKLLSEKFKDLTFIPCHYSRIKSI